MTAAALVVVFTLGYMAIALEGALRLQKAATALIMGAALWTMLALSGGPAAVGHLPEHLSDIAGIVLFLLGAMTIVEVIDSHGGFAVLSSGIRSRDPRRLLWIVAGLSFFLSAILDNLTTTIVILTLARKLLPDRKPRLVVAGVVVIAANAGGAFSPIGDVTTTMLWIGGQISALTIIRRLFLPSLVNLLVPLAIATLMLRAGGGATGPRADAREAPSPESPGAPAPDAAAPREEGPSETARREPEGARPEESILVLIIGVASLVAVPFFHVLTHLPPWLGMLLALGLVWIATELLHRGKEGHERDRLGPASAFSRIDMQSIMFFVGILLAVAALQSAGLLAAAATWLGDRLGDTRAVVFGLGLLSSVVDNVPLVAGAMGMYSLAAYPTDSLIWEFLAYTAGTGGSILIIGSAAGVVAMGIEGIGFGWYLRRFAPLALAGYVAGAAVYLLLVH